MIGHVCRRFANTRSAARSQACLRGLVAAAALGPPCSAAARADVFARFDLWVEATAVVQSGDVIDVAVWAQLSGPVLDIGLNAMAGFNMNLPFNTSGDLVSAVENPQFGHPYFNFWFGEVSTAAIFGVAAFQLDIWDTPIWLDNPILLFSTRLHTIDGETGEIEIVPERRDTIPSIIAWWIDIDDYARPNVDDTDPNAELNITGATIRVIPAPASLAVLGLGALAARRRR